jgi:hypothetical protein
MGGPGSGVKWNKKGTVDGRRCLDVRELHRAHGIKSEYEMTVKSEWRGEEVVQKIILDWTLCNYGGLRPWFICGNCGRRVAKLYSGGKEFACRHCLDLTYTSCQESDSRFGRFLQNYDGLGWPEDLPYYALKGLTGQMIKKREQLKKLMARRRRGQPAKKASEG